MPAPPSFVYDESNYPRMGTVRKSFQTNPLLCKPMLGSVKKPTYELPEPNYIYGLCSDTGSHGVKEAFGYHAVEHSDPGIKGPYFISMNRMATCAHLVKASELRPFRKNHYVPLPMSHRVTGETPLPSDRNPDHVYGKQNVIDKNMQKIMQNGYAEDWINLQKFQQHKYKVPKLSFIPPITNRATVLSAKARLERENPTPPKERFIMNKFKNVKHKIDNVQKIPLKRD